MGYARLGIHLACGGLLAWLGWAFVFGRLGFNPVESLTHQTGLWALRLMAISLAVTPLRWWLKRPQITQMRRPLGLWAFAFACIHLTIFVIFDLQLSFARLLEEVTNRNFILLGMGSLLLMLPLAITSTRGWRRKLGPYWQKLHWLVYPSALLAAWHFVSLSKGNQIEPYFYLAIIVTLLAVRLIKKSLSRFQPTPVRR